MKDLKKIEIPISVTKKHKIVWNLMWIITYIIFFPIVLIQFLNDIFEIIIDFFATLRSKMVHSIFKLLFLKECKYESEE